MGTNKMCRFAPSRNGVQIASAWRVWVQGNEFYASTRCATQLAKISFHHAFNWQLRMGAGVLRLARPLQLNDDWLQALRLVFLVDEGVLIPLEKPEEKVSLIEVAPGKKLSVDIVLSKRTNVAPLRATPAAQELGRFVLRDGRRLGVVAITPPFKAIDADIVADVRKNLWAGFDQLPLADQVYIEGIWHDFSPQHGNKIAVIPVGFDSVGVTLTPPVVQPQ